MIEPGMTALQAEGTDRSPVHGSLLERLLCLTFLLAAGTSGPSVACAAEVVAVRADDFLNSIGVCSAVSRRGESFVRTVDAARYLGIRWIRAGYESRLPVADLIELHRQTGVRFSYGLMSGGTDIARLLEGGRELAAVGALIALEGNNEPNNWGVTHEGQRGGRTNSWLPVARLQRDLYRAAKSDPVLKDYPVWSLSENGAQEDNVGLQFLTIPSGAGTLMPDATRYADYANCHNYLTHPGWPGLHDNQTWIAADPTSVCRVDGLYGNYGLTWRRRYTGYSESSLSTLPRVTTETGVTLQGAINEQVQACLYLSVYLDQFKRGWKHTAIYLLRDRTDEGGNQTFGFYQPDYTPRPAAIYLHNLTTILADEASTMASGTLDYSILEPPATVHELLLQKSDGRFALVVWNERFTGGSDNVTVKLGTTAASVKVYDPTVGTSPIQSLSQVGSIGLTLSNHPLVIEIPAPIRSAGATAGEGQGHALAAPGFSSRTQAATGPLRVHPTNPRYFTDGTTNANGSLNAVYLTGSHTWGNLCDYRTNWPAFDFPAYLDFLERHHHNFIRLWTGDGLGHQPVFHARTGPGTALDGGLQVDLDRFDPAFFDRLRSRAVAARDHGVYVGIMLFSPDSGAKREDWKELLFNPANNTQGINADTNGDASGAEAYDLSIPRITAYQEAFVRKVVDTVNDLDNVLYEIGNEGDFTSVPWQHHFIRFIREHEAGKPKQHPVGMTAVFNILNGSWATDNRVLFDSPADWISPGLDPYKDNPPATDGKKVILADVDHIWPTPPHRGWIWQCFLRGMQPMLMDWYSYGDPKWTSPEEQEALRKQMGYTLDFARRVNLAAMTPRSELASTTYCLANPGVEYLVYQPKAGEVVSVILNAGKYRFEWFDPANGATAGSGRIEVVAGRQEFKAPMDGDAVLYLKTQ